MQRGGHRANEVIRSKVKKPLKATPCRPELACDDDRFYRMQVLPPTIRVHMRNSTGLRIPQQRQHVQMLCPRELFGLQVTLCVSWIVAKDTDFLDFDFWHRHTHSATPPPEDGTDVCMCARVGAGTAACSCPNGWPPPHCIARSCAHRCLNCGCTSSSFGSDYPVSGAGHCLARNVHPCPVFATIHCNSVTPAARSWCCCICLLR